MAEQIDSSPFFRFDTETWSGFRHSSDKLNLTEDDLRHLKAFNDIISLEDVRKIYLPLSRLLNLHFHSRHDRLSIIQKFLGKPMDNVPFIISITGPVSAGKTTTARLLNELIKGWPEKPQVTLITTDGFLYPNDVLEERMILGRKGFPISYDVKKLMRFLVDLKDGKPNLKVPVYSHLTYDVVPNEYTLVDRPDILILEGVNVLQTGEDYPDIKKTAFIADFIDYSIYVDADEKLLLEWYVDRFLKLRESAFNDPNCYFHKYANIPEEQAIAMARLTWEAVNHPNLVENIKPSMSRANLVLRKGKNHKIFEVDLRK
ncbi:MAG: type I pantothenate kinase [Succinivibrio sp.]|nr:type I pantothenate kinase [Succinivibrio sp.]